LTKAAPVRMYDAVTPRNIPESAEVVAGYVDGNYAWPPEAWHRWPGALKVLITVFGSTKGNVADVESGNMTPGEARKWIEAKHREDVHESTVYCSRSVLEEVRAVCRGLDYFIWVADWTDSPHRVPGTVATQYSNAGNAYDLSMAYSQEWLDVINKANRPWPCRR
jgi:hypothetical protein